MNLPREKRNELAYAKGVAFDPGDTDAAADPAKRSRKNANRVSASLQLALMVALGDGGRQ